MRMVAAAIFTTAVVLTAAPAPAQTYGGNAPVCMQRYRWGGSDIECAYTSLAQCAATRHVHRKSVFCARADACGTNVPAISLASDGLAISGFRVWADGDFGLPSPAWRAIF